MSVRVRGVACAVACGAISTALHRLRDALPSPPIGAWADAAEWYDAVGPPTATVALLRIIALALCSWIAVASSLQVAASVRVPTSVRRAADAISPGWLRELGRSMAGLSLSAGVALPLAGGALGTSAIEPVPRVDVVDPEPDQDADGVAIMRTEQDTAADATDEHPEGVATMQLLPAPHPSIHVVSVGDSCWSIAAELLRDAYGAEPDGRAIWTAWTALIELNRPRFATGDPDLLFPGQQLLLPEVGH